MQSAVEDGLIAQNPASKVGRFLPKDREKFEAVFLSREELERFLDSVQTLSPEHYPLFLTFARTGLRLGEALALRWGDIQFGQDASDANRYLWIRRNYTAGRFVTPKSGKSRRVDMSQQLRTALLGLRERRLLDAMLGACPASVSVLRHASPTPELANADDARFRGDAPSEATRATARVENAAQPVRFAQCHVRKLYSRAHGDPCECGERGTPLTAPFIFC